jgi:hypothetical protein
VTEDLIKEYLSNQYVGIIAGQGGYFLDKPSHDSGIDFTVRYNLKYDRPDGTFEYLTAPHFCDLQIKATTTNSIKLTNNHIIYDLRAKNYRDLIRRRDLGIAPLFLILFILPKARNQWVKIFENRITLSKHAYWFFPDISYQDSSNESTKRIKISINNKLDLSFFKTKFDEWYNLS